MKFTLRWIGVAYSLTEGLKYISRIQYCPFHYINSSNVLILEILPLSIYIKNENNFYFVYNVCEQINVNEYKR